MGGSKKNICVIGGNGYLGKPISDYLGATPLSRFNGFDILNEKDCEALSDFDVVIHMAAQVDKSDKNIESVFKTNIEGTRNVIKALNNKQIFIFTSTKEVYNLGDAYSYSKLIAEKFINFYSNKYKIQTGVFRLATVYAPSANGSTFVNFFCKAVKEGIVLKLLMEGKQLRDFLFVEDLARAFNAFLKNHQSDTFDIGGGKENSATILGFLRMIEEKIGKKAVYEFSNDPVLGNPHHVTDLKKITQHLKWRPTFGISEGLKKIL